MAFKLVSKNNIGIFTTLILVVLLSQSNLFDFLIDTPLGRITLLAFIILIAYTNQILGLIAVLCIIIAFNNNVNIVSGYNLYEGLENNQTKNEDTKKTIKPLVPTARAAKARDEQLARRNAQRERSIPASTEGREGFCMAEREINMLRGKQSNTISVSNHLREQSDDVNPSDNSVFTSEYASF